MIFYFKSLPIQEIILIIESGSSEMNEIDVTMASNRNYQNDLIFYTKL